MSDVPNRPDDPEMPDDPGADVPDVPDEPAPSGETNPEQPTADSSDVPPPPATPASSDELPPPPPPATPPTDDMTQHSSAVPPPPPPPPAPTDAEGAAATSTGTASAGVAATTGGNKKRWALIGSALVVLALVVIGFLGRSSANGAAEDYERDLAAWEDEQLPELVTKASTPPENLYPSENPTKEVIDAQRAQCEQMTATATELEESDELDPPTLGGHLFGFLSGAYADAKKLSEKSGKEFTDYRDEVVDVHAQLASDCSFQVGNLEVNQSIRAAGDVVEKYAMDDGERIVDGNTTYTCNSDDGCYPPPVGDRFDKWLEAVGAKNSVWKKESDRFFASDACKDSSFGEDLCTLMKEHEDDWVASEGKIQPIMKKIDGVANEAEEKELKAARKARDDQRDANEKAFDAEVVKVRPELKDDPKLKLDEVSWFGLLKYMATERYASLKEDAPGGPGGGEDT